VIGEKEASVKAGLASMRSALALVLVSLLAGCARNAGQEAVPAANLATTRAAQEAFRPIRQRWMTSTRDERSKLEPNLTWFIQQFSGDGLVLLAKVYLALVSADRGDLERAKALTEEVLHGPGGTAHDLAELARGAILRKSGQPAQAFDRLLPLVGKLIDPYARALFDEELVHAAIDAQRWYEAVAYMDLWLREAQDEALSAARSKVDRALLGVPPEALELMLQAMRADRGRAGYGTEIRRAVVARLAAVAIEQGNTELARRLVESSGANPVTGDVAEGLEELASSGGAPAVDGRTIGLLVTTGAGASGLRAAEVLGGMMDALRVSEERVRLTTRDERDPKRAELALAALASQGAAVLVAGLDVGQSKMAASFSERTGIPMILLTPPPSDQRLPPSAFVLSSADAEATALLAEGIAARGARIAAAVGGTVPSGLSGRARFLDGVSCDVTAQQAGDARFPVASWRESKVDAVLLLGDAPCARDAVGETSKLVGMYGVGLGSGEIVAEPVRAPTVAVAAGKFPLRKDDASPLEGYRKRHGAPPSWFTVLGHDAAVLARAALRPLPLDRAESAEQVKKRHGEVVAALLSAEGDLWSTDARGFQNGRRLPREFKLVEVR
jgi:hypothetical protein